VFDVFGQSDAEPTLVVKEPATGANNDRPKGDDTPAGDDADENPYALDDDQDQEEEVEEEAGSTETKPVVPGKGSGAEIRSLLEAQLAKSTGRVIKLPDDTTEENVAIRLMEMGRKELHPEALRLQKAIEDGIDPRAYYASYSQYDQALALPDAELVKRSLTATRGKSDERPDGWDDAKIADKVARMDPDTLEERALEIKTHIRAQKAQRDQQLSEASSHNAGPDPASPEFKKIFDEGFNDSFNEVMKDGDFYGMKFVTPEKQKAVAARLHKMLMPDATTRQNKFVQALQDPKEAMKIALLYDMAQSGALRLGAAKSQAAARRSLGAMLDKRTSTGTGPKGGEKNDFAVFSQPEG